MRRDKKELGGTMSILHRPTPYKQRWAQMRDGDLWDNVVDLVTQRGPHSVWITKVKGHATKEMVEEGKVELEEKEGNDAADKAADLGAMDSQIKVHRFGEMYCRRHK